MDITLTESLSQILAVADTAKESDLDLFKMFINVLGGLGIFLVGMKNMSEGMQAVAGERIRKLINMATTHRILGCGLGTLITSIIQSSSITTVMVVGMVNAELMNLTQAISVIMGANIGTTITAWLFTFKISKYGLLILGCAAFVYLFSKKDRVRFLGMFFLGLGMVFFGLEMMSDGFKPLRSYPQFVEWFHRFSPTDYWGVIKCCLAGATLTSIVQSSSATLGITIALAISGTIDFETGAALVLGENIGTTITALLASIGTSTNARRAAVAHTIFNLVGVFWITLIFHHYIEAISWFVEKTEHVLPNTMVTSDEGVSYPYRAVAIAATHTGFNVVNTLLFLPFVHMLAKLLKVMIKERHVPQATHLTYLDVRMFDTPAIAIEQSGEEVVRMSRRTVEMMDDAQGLVSAEDKLTNVQYDKIFQAEQDMDVIQKEIVEFIGNVMAGNISHDVTTDGREQIRMADEFESISDYIVTLIKLRLKLDDGGLTMSEDARLEVDTLHSLILDYLQFIATAVSQKDKTLLSEARNRGNSITREVKEFRARHLNRVQSGNVHPLKSLIYTDMLRAYRRIKDHAYNIAEVLAGEK